MRRAHRTGHFLLWLLLIPALAATAFLALHHGPREAVNEALPEAIVGEES